MSLRYYANAAATALASSCTSGATTIEVDSASGLPITYPFILILDRGTASEEVVLCTNASGESLTVTRGYDSTTGFAHSIGAEVVHGIAAIDAREANEHVNATDNVHGLTGDLVGSSDTQTLTNKTISTDNNDISGLAASSFAVTDGSGVLDGSAAQKAIPSGVVVGTTDSQTLTNKTIDVGDNTVTGTLAEFNAALSGDNFVSLTGSETLTNKSLTSPTITGIGAVTFAMKSASESVTSSDVVQDDNDLVFAVPGAGTYVVDFYLGVNGAAAADIDFAFEFPSGSLYLWYSSQATDATAADGTARHIFRTEDNSSPTTETRAGLTSTEGSVHIRALLVASDAGDLQLQWAQGTSNVTATQVLKGSHMIARRVA